MAEAVVETGNARVGNLRISYESTGAGAPALVFIHGVLGTRSDFAPQTAHFSGHGRVVALDLRGHGRSSVPDTVTIDDFAEDVMAVVDDLGLESAVLCGHSMGGVVGLKVAEARPAMVRGVVMVEGTVLFPEEVRSAGLNGLVPALAGDRWSDALRDYFNGRILDRQDPQDLKRRVLAEADRARPEFVHSFFANLLSSDYATAVVNARCPMLYIHSKTPADLRRLRELRPDAWVGQVVGSGHYPMLTVPDQVNAMLDRFLEMVDAHGQA